ncbi:MAG: alpha-glucan family phosphorylase [Acidobacteria bacterium]|nr:alpha-glucan family phosphorylase [Acidobacteriota bacterium]
MEIGLANDIPTYAGGLGVLAGDTIKSAADLGMPLVGVTLLYRKGYFRQEITPAGRQVEHPVQWRPENFMRPLPNKVHVLIDGRKVSVGTWQYEARSVTSGTVPVLFLDTDLEENHPEDKEITAVLYGGDPRYRFKQEIVLGIAGYRMLQSLGMEISRYHMNEGHASLLTLELLRRYRRPLELVWAEEGVWDLDGVRRSCIFTTHTPEASGHDKFDYDLAEPILRDDRIMDILKQLAGRDQLNMTLLALNLSHYVNGVAKKHGEVSRGLFPGYEFNAITNGVHSFTWTCPSFRRLYDRYLPGWANEPELFVRVDNIPPGEIWDAHAQARLALFDEIYQRTGTRLDPEAMTLGFARRATAYKRAELIFSDLRRLTSIAKKRKLQLVYAGKAHPRDETGKRLIENIFSYSGQLRDALNVTYLQDYDMALASKLVSGVDLWLNTPLRPHEASGTSGMKAAHNGVPNFSVLDGWWIEGHIEGVTGWSIGATPDPSPAPQQFSNQADAEDLYHKLEHVILPLFYDRRMEWIQVMRGAIGKNAYYFNTHRMMRRYATEAYLY